MARYFVELIGIRAGPESINYGTVRPAWPDGSDSSPGFTRRSSTKARRQSIVGCTEALDVWFAPGRRFARWRRHVMRHGVQTWTLVSITGLAGTAFLFIGIADTVLEGGMHHFDTWLLLSLRNPTDPTDPLGPAWFEVTMRDIKALGGTTILVFVSLAAVGYSLMMGMRHAAIAMAAATLSGIALSHALKWGFDRPRPDLVPHGPQARD